MADHHHQDDHARSISPSLSRSRGSWKAESSLQKILDTIAGNDNKIHTNSSIESSSSISLSVVNVSESDGQDERAQMGPNLKKKALIDIDLNVIPLDEDETDEDSVPLAGDAGDGVIIVDEKSTSTEECNESFQLETDPDEEMSQREKKSRRLGKWESFLEVVKLVSGDGESEPVDPSELSDGKIKGNAEEGEGTAATVTAAEEEEEEKVAEKVSAAASPVVRTKSERVRVLPYKYRDSVVEPITRSSRHNRSSSSSSHVPTKRRAR